MLPEVGHFSLILALVLSVFLALIPMIGAWHGQQRWMAMARPLATGQFVFVAFSFAVLVDAFMGDDFSVRIVANNSNLLLPDLYKFTAVWGNHEGSLLLWILILSGWTVAVAAFSRSLPDDMTARVLSVMGMIAIGFLAFQIFTSNPFERNLPQIPADGRDLNPLLQDIAMAIHPPMLYCGYVGFSVAFAFAIAALSSGRLDAAWARWSRPWTNIAWAMLTAGIALGSWWAYYELGWGGWWFWDPVENASFMPWLVGTALIHSLAVTEKRGIFKSWTVLLAIFAFSLSLLGTFLVRSGVLTSVHSFAADPERGIFILIFLGIVVGGSLTLYALRAPTVSSQVSFQVLSREAALLMNNVLLLVACLGVLLGTLFPMIMDALELGKYSVGAPVFNMIFVPLMAILAVFLGTGPALRWKRNEPSYLKAQLLVAAIASVIIGLVFPFLYDGEFNIAIVLAVMLAAWITLSLLQDLRAKTANASGGRLAGLRRLTPSYYGMQLAHIGFAVSLLGICIDSHYRDERDVRLEPGQTYEMAGYRFFFNGVKDVSGPNYQARRGSLSVYKQGTDDLLFRLYPEKRQYKSGGNTMTEAAIDPSVSRDVYVALGESLGGGAWAVRIHYKPFVRWIWAGAAFMFLGGVITVWDKRYRRVRVASKSSQESDTSGSGVVNTGGLQTRQGNVASAGATDGTA